jgi:3-oxoacyl-[acyl-carrier protein] reductase
MMLENKVAVIYGGGGSIGSAVAMTFAREGAKVFLAGRTQANLDKVANAIRAKGGDVQTAVVDALDEQAVNQYVDDVVKQAGHIDISFNLISVGDVQKPLNDISLDDFLQPIMIAMRTQFLTTRAASRHMMQQKSGVILIFGGDGLQTPPGMGGLKISLDATESLRRQWSVELGAYGIRVVTLKTGGIPESLADTFAPRDEITKAITDETLLKRAAT